MSVKSVVDDLIKIDPVSGYTRSKDIGISFSNQLWKIISGPLLLILITFYLSNAQQGYWFLFISLAALSTFADLGFGNLVIQLVAHEYGQLNREKNNKASTMAVKKLRDILHLAINRSLKSCLLVFPIIYLIGIFFLTRDKSYSEIIPWTLFIVGSGVTFIGYILLAYIEGLDRVAITNSIRLISSIVSTLLVIVFLLSGFSLYALALGSLGGGISVISMVWFRFSLIFRKLLNEKVGENLEWKEEINTLFYKYGLSFISGYFIFSAYVPIMFYFKGSMESGKLGLSIAIIMSIFSISNIWISTIVPQLNIYISIKNREYLDALFFSRFKKCLATYFTMVIILWALVYFFPNLPGMERIVSRLSDSVSLVILGVCYFLQLIVSCWATYVRAHKIEPFTLPSIAQAIWVLVTTLIFITNMSPKWFFLGLLSSYIWWVPVAFYIYKSQRNL